MKAFLDADIATAASPLGAAPAGVVDLSAAGVDATENVQRA